ncbi:glycosyltransferase family 2 protein [Rhizobium leucaenae]|uniref:Glycosyltransferase involved in cell wall biosynthesis n=1 Tax=Rhizobium leucaenae TaxID=29450 RepID=A0A7W6ZV91_9HYPH|nr:glycosyltransferase family 2 protein [Rhizobium leucaenae]MBB4569284.1 glycosyltransferase involved in cell wall biosynthesis [Rhizobium leucaenae]MBB6302736.1 glycosyltransferase involved in cell wall biosynthesis [Rhizobium leucaenae]
MSGPLISVVLPVYNGEPYLAAAIESILRQDYKRLDVIAIDDGSTDRSLDILQRHQEADGRLRIVSRENRGLIATLNEGIAMANGELVARMDADDIAYPTRFSRQIALFQERPRLAICGTGVDRLIGNRVVRGTPNPIHQSADWHVLSMFYTVFMHSTVIYNRNIIPADMLAYDATYVHAEDFDVFRRITREFPAAMIDDSLVAYRVHDESVTNKHKWPMRRTHLKIAAENLQRESLIDDADALHAIGAAVTPDTVRRAADCLLAIEEKIAARGMQTSASHKEGFMCFFYFVYQLIADEKQPQLTHQFLTQTGKWHTIRRQERYGLRAAAYAPWCSRIWGNASVRLDALARYRQSVPIKNVPPLQGLA